MPAWQRAFFMAEKVAYSMDTTLSPYPIPAQCHINSSQDNKTVGK